MFHSDIDGYFDGLFTKVQIQWISRFSEVLRTVTFSLDSVETQFSFSSSF